MRNSKSNHVIWVDLDNSPHVPFFKPIVEELQRRGHELIITARDCFQVCGLADLLELRYKRVGRHYGKNKLMKVAGTLVRSLELSPTIFRTKPSLALSHGSRSQLILATLLGIRSVLILDYEYTQSLPGIRPTWSIMPEVIPVDSSNIDARHLIKYPGIKEDVYVPDFKPNPSIIEELNVDEKEILVTVRPPATEAHYHISASTEFFIAVLDLLGKKENIRLLLLPRNDRQESFIRTRWPELCASRKIVIPEHVVDGLNLMWFSDLVISGGGTMNREAAALGVPVYSIFRGKTGAVDRYLSEEGRLTLLETIQDVEARLVLKKRDKQGKPNEKGRNVLRVLVDAVESILADNTMAI